MRVRYLLDTNIVSEPLRARPDSVLMRKLRRHEGEVAIGTPAWHELVYGCARLPASRRRQAIETYLLEVAEPSMPILPYSREAAEWHARERSRLEARGVATSFVDGQIASIAVVNDLVLVTADTAHYSRFRGLEQESWLATRRGR
jgi:tRNA(fMet)-specific endonuclease VapC